MAEEKLLASEVREIRLAGLAAARREVETWEEYKTRIIEENWLKFKAATKKGRKISSTGSS